MNPLPRPRGYYFAPTYKQAKSIAWDYLREYTKHIPGSKYNKTELSWTIPQGHRIELVGANDVDSFRGNYADEVCLDEFSIMPPRIWGEIIRPALADRKGSAIFIGTPAGRNAFWRLYDKAQGLDNWGRMLLTYQDTGLLDAEEIESLRAEMDEDQFNQELLCDFQAAVKGAYYGKAMAKMEADGRICDVPYDEQLGVWTSWDLGIADAMAICFWQTSPGGEHRLIDYEEYTGQGLPGVIRELRAKPYVYNGHIAPHDIRVRELGTGQSRYEVAGKLGIGFHIARKVDLMDGIDATRSLLGKTWIDRTKCEDLINHLQLYRTEWDDKKGVFSTRPLHDHTSHGADSVRMYAVENLVATGEGLGGPALNYDMLNRMA